MARPDLSLLKTELLKMDGGYAISMVDAIEKRAAQNEDYANELNIWLKRGSTIRLRDTLCEPFQNFSFIEYYRKAIPLTWFNMWMSIDTAMMHVRENKRQQP